MVCPYCNSEESCEHHLLTVDLGEHQALGGALYELFSARWNAVRPKADKDDEDFDEELFRDCLAEVFQHCVEEAEELATEGDIDEVEAMEGMGVSTQLDLYCSTLAEVDAAVQRYRKLSDATSTLTYPCRAPGGELGNS